MGSHICNFVVFVNAPFLSLPPFLCLPSFSFLSHSFHPTFGPDAVFSPFFLAEREGGTLEKGGGIVECANAQIILAPPQPRASLM